MLRSRNLLRVSPDSVSSRSWSAAAARCALSMVGFVVAAGCGSSQGPSPAVVSPPAPPSSAPLESLEIVSARRSAWAGRSRVVLVFDTAIDPSTVGPDQFQLLRADGEPCTAIAVRMSPSNENDELHTLRIELAEDACPAVAVRVTGHLYARDGRPVQGARAEVVDDSGGPTVVGRPSEVEGIRCRRFAGDGETTWTVLRTRWSDDVGWAPGLAVAGLIAGIRVRDREGRWTSLAAVDDIEARPERSELGDNVVDLCFPRGVVFERLEIASGLFQGPSGATNPKLELALTRGGDDDSAS